MGKRARVSRFVRLLGELSQEMPDNVVSKRWMGGHATITSVLTTRGYHIKHNFGHGRQKPNPHRHAEVMLRSRT
jgi:hypothetical protein